MSADSPDSADLQPEGARLAELIEMLPLSRGSIFELIRALGIATTKGPGPEGKGRVAWLNDRDVARLSEAAFRVDRGEVRIKDLAQGLATQPTQQTAITAASGASADSADPTDPQPFLARLEAAERAITSGLGLTTSEVSWILGVKPASSPVTRGGITATRTGWNCWRLTRVE
jgi:hypothetical protein